MAHPAIRQTAVVAREDESGDMRLIAYLVTAEEQTITSRELRRLAAKQLPEAWVPAAFVTLDAFPTTPSGKVDRRALPSPHHPLRPELEDHFVAQRNDIEAAIAVLWQQLLRCDRVGIHDHFFELGGHSLLAMRMLFRVADITQSEISLARFLSAPTVAGLSAEIEAAKQAGPDSQMPPIVPVPRDGVLPASIAQEQIWQLDQALPVFPLFGLIDGFGSRHKGALNISQQLRLRGPLSLGILEQSFNEIITRHENLRTTFAITDGQLVQMIEPSLAISPMIEDLRALPEHRRENEAQRRLQEEAQRPFNLEHGPLLRAHLLWLGEQEHMLLITIHHIICDGISLGILAHELAILYDAYAFGEPSPLPELPIQYADFVAWQRNWEQHAELQEQLNYWKRQLCGPLPKLANITDNSQEFKGFVSTDIQHFELTNTLYKALKRFSQEQGTTPFTTFLAAFNIALYQYTGQTELCIATLAANRVRQETEGLIGLLMNTVLLKTNLGGNPTYIEVLRRVREIVKTAFANQELPFEALVRTLEQERGLQRSSLCHVLVIWQHADMESEPLLARTLRFEMIEQGRGIPNAGLTTFDIILTLREQSEKLAGSMIYNAERYKAEVIAQVINDFYMAIKYLSSNNSQFILKHND